MSRLVDHIVLVNLEKKLFLINAGGIRIRKTVAFHLMNPGCIGYRMQGGAKMQNALCVRKK